MRSLENILDIIFPPLCFSCKNILSAKEKNLGICGNCWRELKINFHFFCPFCGGRLPNLKNNCHKKEKFILGAPFEFNNPKVRNIIHNLKYFSAKKAAFSLGFFIVQYLLQIPYIHKLKKAQNKIILLPLPLHKSKERKRGFNQASLIAQGIKLWKEKLDVNELLPSFEVNTQIIQKIKNTPSQTEKNSAQEREENVRDSFKINDKINFSGKYLIIVDDVFTSGATLREVIKTLKQNKNIKKIIALTAAKV